MPGLRVHPNYHGYGLEDPAFAELLSLAARRRLIVRLALCMEDERTRHPLVRVSAVDLTPLADLVKRAPKARLMILNCHPRINLEQLQPLASAGEVYFEFSMVEGIGGVARLARHVSLERVVFGSNYPLFCSESAVLKVQISGLDTAQKNALFEENVRRLLSRAASGSLPQIRGASLK